MAVESRTVEVPPGEEPEDMRMTGVCIVASGAAVDDSVADG
jgi:hypothetical protein